MILKFIKKYPSHLMHSGARNPGTVYPYPASWARLDKSLKHAKLRPQDLAGKTLPDNFLRLAAGFIGLPTAAAFLDFVKNYVFKLSADDILNNFDKVEEDVKAMTNDKKNEALDQVVLYLKENDLCATQIKNLTSFLSHVSDEVVVDFTQNIMTTKNLHNIKMITSALKSRIVDSVRGISTLRLDK